MIDLEKHIRAQREALDSQLPAQGHEDRFLLKQRRNARRKVPVRHVLQVAASIAIILASAFVMVKQHKSGSKIAAMEAMPPSLVEADQYYYQQVNQRFDEISAYPFESAEERNILLDELQDLDLIHQQLMEDLQAHPGDDRVINALIRHYQLKLEVMDQIIEQLNQLRTESEHTHENENV